MLDDLGDLQVIDMSADGNLILAFRVGQQDHLILWSAPGTETVVPLSEAGRVFEEAARISPEGTYIVGSDLPAEPNYDAACDPNHDDWTSEGRAMAWVWMNGSTTRLMPPDDYCYTAFDVANTGRIVGIKFIESGDSPDEVHAVSYDGSFQDIHPDGYDQSGARSISADSSYTQTVEGSLYLELDGTNEG